MKINGQMIHLVLNLLLTVIAFNGMSENAFAQRGEQFGASRGGYRGMSFEGFHNENMRSFNENEHSFNGHTSNFNVASTSHNFNYSHTNFAHQNLAMNTHTGIPNHLGANWAHNNWHNTSWHNGNWHGWNNNWHGGWNGGWGWHGGWQGPGWGYGLYFGAVFGTVFAVTVFNPYWNYPYYAYPYYYGYPYGPPYGYPYPYDYYNYPPTEINNYYYTNSNTAEAAPAAEAAPSVEKWVSAKNGTVPANAIINNDDKGKITYYCRAKYMGKTNYGVLVPKDGCYITDKTVDMRFTAYSVLVSG